MAASNRSAEIRENDLRLMPYGESISLLSIPPGVERPGYKYKWACIAIRGEETNDVNEALWNRWEIVPKSRMTFNNYIESTIKTRFSEEGIVRRDCLLMEIDERLYDQYVAKKQASAATEIQNVRGLSRDRVGKPEVVAYI